MHAQISGFANTVSICLTHCITTLTNTRCLDYKRIDCLLFYMMDCNHMGLNTKTLNVALERPYEKESVIILGSR